MYAYRIRDAVGEPHKLNCVLGVPPFGAQSEYEVEGRVVRIRVVVVLRDVP